MLYDLTWFALLPSVAHADAAYAATGQWIKYPGNPVLGQRQVAGTPITWPVQEYCMMAPEIYRIQRSLDSIGEYDQKVLCSA